MCHRLCHPDHSPASLWARLWHWCVPLPTFSLSCKDVTHWGASDSCSLSWGIKIRKSLAARALNSSCCISILKLWL